MIIVGNCKWSRAKTLYETLHLFPHSGFCAVADIDRAFIVITITITMIITITIAMIITITITTTITINPTITITITTTITITITGACFTQQDRSMSAAKRPRPISPHVEVSNTETVTHSTFNGHLEH
jgi:hypothetical protein